MPTHSAETSRALLMRHSCRQRHLKHVHRSAHIRRMCYFRTTQNEKFIAEKKKSMDVSNQDRCDVSTPLAETS